MRGLYLLLLISTLIGLICFCLYTHHVEQSPAAATKPFTVGYCNAAVPDGMKEFDEIGKSIATADRTIWIAGDAESFSDKTDKKWSLGGDWLGHPVDKNADEMKSLLQHDEPKNFLVLYLGKQTSNENRERAAATLKAFASDLGYKRVLILGAHSCGCFVLYDSSNNEQALHY